MSDLVTIKRAGTFGLSGHPIYIPCDRCGARETTSRFYLDHRAKAYGGEFGFVSAFSIHLCEPCIRAALAALGTP